MSPLPNEHACRIFPPGKFKRFVRMEREHNGKKYSAIIGWWKDKEGSADQAYRYDKKTWTEETARNHCEEKDGTFEPAKKEVEAREFKFAYPIELEGMEYPAKIEILREGVWDHPEAPDGVLEVTKKDLETFVRNFNEKVVGEELPLDYEHEPEKGHAIGWITKLWTKVTGGVCHLWAKLNITDEQARQDLKSGCLKYISPQILIGWKNPEDKKNYDVIRSAALTNYPYIKNMEPAIVNFSEISQKEVNNKMDEKEIKKLKEDIEKRELELKEKQTKLEEEYATKKADLETLETTLKESQEKFEADKVELEQAKAKLAEYDTLKADFDTMKKDFDPMKKDFEDTKKIATTAQKVAEVANNEAKALRTEKKEIEANIKADELITAGKVRPADKEVLMQALTADEGATIELKEKDSKETRKLTKSEVLLELIASGPAKVDLSQKGVIIGQKGDVKAQELIDFVNMSDAEIAKLEPEKREELLERLNKYSK